jgi:hypothetical protein
MIRVYGVSPGAGAREDAKHRKTRRKGREAVGSSRVAAME